MIVMQCFLLPLIGIRAGLSVNVNLYTYCMLTECWFHCIDAVHWAKDGVQLACKILLQELPEISVRHFRDKKFYAFTGKQPPKAYCVQAVQERECACMCASVMIYLQFVNMISHKLLVRISPYLQLHCSCR